MECDGLASLSFDRQSGVHRKKESGVEPPHSKMAVMT
jgi:hypothetical protein